MAENSFQGMEITCGELIAHEGCANPTGTTKMPKG